MTVGGEGGDDMEDSRVRDVGKKQCLELAVRDCKGDSDARYGGRNQGG